MLLEVSLSHTRAQIKQNLQQSHYKFCRRLGKEEEEL